IFSYHTTKELTYLSPHIGMLNNIPFVLPFEVCISIFQNFILNDAMQHANVNLANPPLYMHEDVDGRFHARVRAMQRSMVGLGNLKTYTKIWRGNVVQDGFNKLGDVDLKAPMEIVLVDYMFNQQEIQILLADVNAPVNSDDLRKNTYYSGLFDDNHPMILTFWKVVDSFNQEQCIALLMFVTNCSQPLLLAFKKLVPNFSIHDAGPNKPYLSTASTCVNLLKLPSYNNEHILQAKLLQGIMSNVGFNLF
ncbi:Ubiquitin-protein ligase E3C, partial [Leucoagaricus sp. SymC.cos]